MMNLSKLNEIKKQIMDKHYLQDHQVDCLEQSIQFLYDIYPMILTGDASDAEVVGVKAILANLKAAAGQAVVEALESTIESIARELLKQLFVL